MINLLWLGDNLYNLNTGAYAGILKMHLSDGYIRVILYYLTVLLECLDFSPKS